MQLVQINKRRQIAHALFKKVLIITSLLLLVFNLNFGSYEKAKASGFSFADIPGYVDEVYSGAIVGAMATVGAASAHTQQFVQDNIDLIREGAKSAYETLAPQAKESFVESLNAAGDRIVVAGDWITHALDSLKADPVINPPVTQPADLSLTYSLGNVHLSTGYNLKISFNAINGGSYTGELSKLRVSGSNSGSYITLTFAGYQARTYEVDKYFSYFDSIQINPSLNTLTSLLSLFGISSSLVTTDGTVAQESIYDQLYKRLKETDLPSGQLDNLRIPQTMPMTLDGKMLTWNDAIGGLTLDGLPYTGDVTWRTTTDAGIVLPMPQPTITTGTLDLPAGTPVIPIPKGTTVNPTNTDVIVTPDGRVIPIDNVTWTTPDIVWEVVDGVAVPTIKTITGTVINIVTGDIVTDIDLTVPYEPKPPEPKPEEPPPGEPKPPNPLLVSLLMALLDLIRACIMYLMRLFKYLVSLPLVASTPIPLEAFQWFREAEILGIQPYNLVITLAITFASLALFNTIRKMMNSA